MREALHHHEAHYPTDDVLLVGQAFPEIQQTAQKEMMRFLGGVAIRGEMDIAPDQEANNESTLMTAVQQAALGDPRALKVVKTNVATDIDERLFKAGHQTRVTLDMSNGELEQAGRSMLSLYRNALEHTELNPEMVRRTSYEARNGMVVKQLHQQGVLQSYKAVIFSTASTSMSQKEKKRYNFFVDTESCSIQLFSAEEDVVTLESAFVAGKRTPDSERHDIQAIQTLAACHNLPVPGDDGTDMLQHVFLVPKSAVQGVEDVVAWYDEAAGGTFYGQDKPRQDYKAYAETCAERTEQFSDIVQKVTNTLLAEAHTFKTPLDAVLRLDELSEVYCVKRSITDTTLDTAVFGQAAALDIREAMISLSMGDLERAQQFTSSAIEKAESSSCPLVKEKALGGSDGGGEGGSAPTETTKERWMHCPYCSSRVWGDPCAAQLTCNDCKAMVWQGHTISKGNGGTRARRTREAAGRGKLVLMEVISQSRQVARARI